MDINRKCQHLSNGYYNEALRLATERNLSGAISLLKKSLQIDKTNKESRNLLGLIYYEIGEISDALIQWIISYNLDEFDNKAVDYINDTRNDSAYTQTAALNIQQFNQALTMAKSGSFAPAKKILTTILDSNPHYIKAQILMGILYYLERDFRNAGKCFSIVLKLDTGNDQAQMYLNEVKVQLSKRVVRKEIVKGEKKKVKEEKKGPETTIIKDEMYSDTIILPNSKSDRSFLHNALDIGLGLIIGSAVVFSIFRPVMLGQINEKHNDEILTINKQLAETNKQLDILQSDYDTLKDKYDSIHLDSDSLDEQFSEKLAMYQKLSGVLDELNNSNYITAAKIYSGINPELITDVDDGTSVSPSNLYNEIKYKMEDNIYSRITSEGDNYYASGQYYTAIEYYELSIKIKPDNPVAIYKKGLAYTQLGDRQTANSLFTDVIMNYPNSSVVGYAKAERGY